MSTLTERAPHPLEHLRSRVLNFWRLLFAPGDLTALAAAIALVNIPAIALEATGWTISLRILVPVATLSVIFGFFLARSQYNEFFALLVGGLYGFAIVLLVAAINQPGGLSVGLGEIVKRTIQWLTDVFTGGVNPDELVFTLLVAGLLWFLGYNVAWHVFRIDRVWRAVLPPGLILVANNIYYLGEVNTSIYLIAYAFLSLLLMVRSHLETREWDWYMSGVRVPRRLRRQFLRVGGVLALLTVILAWIVPISNLQERLTAFQQFLQQEPARQLAEAWSRLFTTGDLQGPTTTDYYGGDSLQLGGAISLGDQVVMLVEAQPNRRYYWRSRIFDNYANGIWTSAATTRLTDPDAPLEIVHEPYFENARVPVQQVFTIGLNASRLVYTAAQPLEVDLPTRTDLRYANDPALAGAMYLSVIRPFRLLYSGDEYRVTSLMNAARADALRSASEDYPQEIRDLYLNVPFGTTARTLALADQIVASAGSLTAYDKARAVERWLRQNIVYNESIPVPPPNQDAIDWVLFDLRQGYCNYYASSMIIMLRHLGVPARMAAGFSQGEWNEGEQAFVVREKDAHTWVEVYFPGYGWIEFEPTAAQAEIDRGDADFVPPTPTALVPTVTPTPTSTPTPTPTATPATPEQTPQQQAVLTATAAPTDVPTATPTPVAAAPTLPPPLRPQPRDPFGFLAPTLWVIVVVLLVIALLIAFIIFVYWYWEWRGMRGLNPIVRAYARLERYLRLIGIWLTPELTPEERRARIVGDLPAADAPVSAITRLYMTERYGPPKPDPVDEQRSEIADRAWSEVRGSILRRWLRRLVPWRRR